MNTSSSMLAIVLVVITGGVLLTILGLGVGNTVLLRMGLRNTMRRPGQTALLLGGLALSTAIIISAFGLPDSFNYSATTYRLSALGNVDESVIGTFTQAQLNSYITQIKQNPNVQTVVAIGYYSQSPNIVSLRTGFGVHNVDYYAIPPAFDQLYGPLTDTSGRTIHFADLGLHDAFINAALAQSLGVQPGDTIQLAFGNGVTATVRAILGHDIAVTSTALSQTTPEVILPFARGQQIDSSPANTLCIKNIGSGGMDDAGPGNSRSQAVNHTLTQIFGVLPINTGPLVPISGAPGDETTIYALKPDAVNQLLSSNVGSFLDSSPTVAGSSIGTQFTQLPLIFTLLLVGAGMLLLSLLVTLLAAERRAEMGMSRALGLQRTHLIQLVLFEGCGYAIMAALLGILAGIGITSLEIALLAHLPALDASIGGSSVPGSVFGPGQLKLWLTWQSLLSSWCIGVLTTLVILLINALWISRTTIATAIRDLDNPTRVLSSLSALLRSLWTAPRDSAGHTISETSARRRSRQNEMLGRLAWGLWIRGPLCIGLGGFLLFFNEQWQVDWVQQLAVALLLAGAALLLRWIVSALPRREFNWEHTRRLCWSLIGLAWLIEGLLSDQAFLALFQQKTFAGRFYSLSPVPILVSLLLLVSGMVLLVTTNADMLVWLLSSLMRHIRRVAAINRISLVYPLTFRFRTGVTVAMLSTITFLVVLLLTTNLAAVQAAQASATTGGFQLKTDVFGSQLDGDSRLSSQFQALETQGALSRDFALVTTLHLLYLPFGMPMSLSLDLAGHPQYSIALNASGVPLVADDSFLHGTTMPLLARAQGYTSDQQVWDAIKDHPGDAILAYNSQISALPTSNGFTPFHALLPESRGPTALQHAVKIIGIVPANTHWQTIYLSQQTALEITQTPYVRFLHTYLFRLRPGVNETQAVQDLAHFLDIAHTGVGIESLDQASTNGITAMIAIFLSSYLALGLLFGALAIGVIASRAVVERRQQIGMLRAMGFSRSLIRNAFLFEASFVVLLSVCIGAALAVWLSYQVDRVSYVDFQLPVWPILLIVLGCFLIAVVSTSLPAQRAARLHPAEALRYE